MGKIAAMELNCKMAVIALGMVLAYSKGVSFVHFCKQGYLSTCAVVMSS